MRQHTGHLLNTPDIEIWPAGLLRVRGNHDARIVSQASHVLRRKRDGRYLAASLRGSVVPLLPGLAAEPGLTAALAAMAAPQMHGRPGIDAVVTLPLHRLQERLSALDIDGDAYARRTELAAVAEPAWLAFAGFDRYRRPLWLHIDAARAWQRMQQAAARDDVILEAISGYRSHDYQLGIFERKRARGQGVDDILAVNAAPGYSEHHSGLALDISTPGEPAAEESFELTGAHAWLSTHAGEHGFVMSYPRDNPHGIIHEPWHWKWT